MKIQNNGDKDFTGTPIPQCGGLDRGAFESHECGGHE
jgi:hypothetical protein